MDASFMVWIGGLIVRKWLDGSKEIGMNGCRICVVDREGMMVREWSEGKLAGYGSCLYHHYT